MLASHLSPSLASSRKSHPILPTKPCRTTSSLIGKSYIAAGQAGMALHTMAILQAYQADVLKEMDEGGGLTPEAVKELRKATHLALRATKHTARVTPLTRVRTNSPSGSQTRDSGAGGGRSNKECQRLQPLASVARAPLLRSGE